MKTPIALIMVSLSFFALGHPAEEEAHSALLKSIASRADRTVVVDDETFYIVEHCLGCMDGGSTVYDAHGKSVCGYIGYAGTWDSKCRKILNDSIRPEE